ncbi:hypothetical protein DID73_01430 [Candidatus Marinamargulisbacteria bacterium SCGC AG-343-K17]|nr:hypothetical protein DID73_01430 [Candidatus Marinamargulisbacteria bacterium SCGC AG-343-K17]
MGLSRIQYQMTTVARQPRSDKTFIGNKVNTNSIAFRNMMRKIEIIVLDTNINNKNKAEQILEIRNKFPGDKIHVDKAMRSLGSINEVLESILKKKGALSNSQSCCALIYQLLT